MNGVLLASLETGLIFSLLAIGVMISFKILDIADLSVEGTFPLGAFIFARFITLGLNPFISTILSFVAGLIGGYITYFLYKKLKIEAILSGILTMTLLYTVNLRIMGRSNITFTELDTIFTKISQVPKIAILLLIIVVIKLIIDWYFKTEQGYLLVVTGDNETLVKSLGQNPNKYVMIGLMLSNGLVALSGSLMAQYQGFVDITMGQTMIVTALASIIIGEVFKNIKFISKTVQSIIGSIIYRIVFGIAIYVGLNANDLKGITALIVIAFIAYNNLFMKKFSINRRTKNVRN